MLAVVFVRQEVGEGFCLLDGLPPVGQVNLVR